MSHILIENEQRVMTLRFNRADKKNAVTQDMYSELARALNDARDDAGVRVVLLAAQPDCFCSGNDVLDFLNAPLKSVGDSPVIRFMQALADFPKPVVAAASGVAVGVGVTLLLHCDLVYCGEKTKLNMPFVSLGICPEFASTYVLPRLMGHQRACELMLLGEPFTPQTALAYGMVNSVLPNEQVEALAREKAVQLAQLPPNAIRTTKALLKRWSQATANDAIKVEAQHFGPMLKMPEGVEAFTAFAQKRKPDFSKFN